MKAVPYLVFNGNCREAFGVYHEVLGGQIAAMFTHADTPAATHCPPEMQDTIMHARLELGEGTIMGSDAPTNMYQKPQGFHVSIHPSSVEEAERIYAALSEGGEIFMAIQETFWAERFAMFADRFGSPWMINVEKPMG
jgi:PhnB protein